MYSAEQVAAASARIAKIKLWPSTKFGGRGCPDMKDRTKVIRAIMVHATDGSERMNSAGGVCAWWDVTKYKDAKTGELKTKARGEAHFVCDPGQVICYAPANRNVPHGNAGSGWSIGVEITGLAKQTREEWLDQLSRGALTFAAQLCADLCIVHTIEVRKLTPDEIKAINAGTDTTTTGFCAHVDMRDVLKSGTHYDPGPHFPWLEFLVAVRGYITIIEREYHGVAA